MSLLSVSLGLLSMHLVACDTGDRRPPIGAPQRRPAEYRICPEFEPIDPPADLVLDDHELRNVDGTAMARVESYKDPTRPNRSLSLYTGFDPLEPMEDLDFEPVDLAGSADDHVDITESMALSGELVVVAWTDPARAEPCSEMSIVGRGLGVEELVDLSNRLGSNPGA